MTKLIILIALILSITACENKKMINTPNNELKHDNGANTGDRVDNILDRAREKEYKTRYRVKPDTLAGYTPSLDYGVGDTTPKEILKNEADLLALARIINAEAGDQDRECKLAVGSVVLNRVKDNRFPDTIIGVIHQKGQYAPVSNGTFYLEPSEESWSTARELMDKGSVMPENVLFQTMAGSEMWGTYYKQIGTEVFSSL